MATLTDETLGLHERKKLRTQQDLQAAALKLFAERGFDEVTTDDLAAAADVSKTTFYRYFASKEDVVIGSASEKLELMRAALADQAATQPALVAVRDALLSVAELYQIDREQRIAVGQLIRATPSLAARNLEHQAAWEELVRDFLTSRLGASTGDLRPRVMAAAVMGTARGAIDYWTEHGADHQLRDVVADAFQMLIDGDLGASAPRERPMTALAEPVDDQIPDDVYARRWWTLAVLCLSLLIVFVGNSSLNVTIPTLSRELGATESQLQWVIAIYSLVFAGLLFSSGAIGDRFGRKGALQLGLLIFFTACVAATFSNEMWQLIACRAAMGVGAAFIMPSTLSILVNVFPPDERTKAIAIWAAVTGAAGAIGPVASGLLLNHFWYGSVFLVNVPIIALAVVSGWFLVPKSKDPAQGRLDPMGAVLSIVGIVSVVYGLIEAPEKGWLSAPTLLAFGLGVVVLTLFVVWELRSPEPMLDIRFFRNPAFSTGTSGMILVFMAMYGVMFLITQYFQLILGYTPLDAAVRLLPMAPIMIIVAPLTPRLSERFGANRTVASGLFFVAGGLLMFRALSTSTPYWYILVSLVPLVSGIALAMSPMTAAIMSAVPPRRAGAGSAMNDASRELGAAFGVAIMGSVAASQYAGAVDSLTASLPAASQDAARSSIAGALQVASDIGGDVGTVLTRGAETAFVDGIHFAVTVGALLAAVAAFIVLRYLPRRLAHQGALHGAGSSLEDAAELGLGGVPPLFPDDQRPDERFPDDRDLARTGEPVPEPG